MVQIIIAAWLFGCISVWPPPSMMDGPGKGKRPSNLNIDTSNVDQELRKTLLQMLEDDQKARANYLDWFKQRQLQRGEQLTAADKAELEKMASVERKNTAKLKKIVDKHGWPTIAKADYDGASAAWFLAIYADKDRSFQKKCLTLLKKAVDEGEANKADWAYLTDRILVAENKLQIYGTQVKIIGQKVEPMPVQDPANLEKRRAELGMPPMSEYLERVKAQYFNKN